MVIYNFHIFNRDGECLFSLHHPVSPVAVVTTSAADDPEQHHSLGGGGTDSDEPVHESHSLPPSLDHQPPFDGDMNDDMMHQDQQQQQGVKNEESEWMKETRMLYGFLWSLKVGLITEPCDVH